MPAIGFITAIVVAKMARRPSFLIFLFPLGYMTVYYIAYLINIHYWQNPAGDFQIWFRVLAVLLACSIVVFLITEACTTRIVNGKQKEYEEKLKYG